MDATFYGPSAKSRILRMELLNNRTFDELIGAESFGDILRIMNGTPYGVHIKALSLMYSSYELLELASDRRMFETVMKLAEAPPSNGSETIKSYLSRWDIESIKSLITSKFLGAELKRTDLFIVDQNNFPLVLMGKLLSKEDYSLIMNESDVEGISKYLIKLGYGVYLMRYIEEYRKEKDISVLLYSLDLAYYMRLSASVKYFLGNEEPMRDFVRSEIDLKNLLTLLKGKELKLDFEIIMNGLIEFGNLSRERMRELYANDFSVVKTSILSVFGVKKVPEGQLGIGDIEVLLRKELYTRTIDRFSIQANSIGQIFLTILKYEMERNNLRLIFAGKAYGLKPEKIKEMMITL